MLDTVCATLLCPHTSRGACTIDSIHHLQSDVVNFTFTKGEKINTILTIKVLDFRFGEVFLYTFYKRLYLPPHLYSDEKQY
jgi:hypothetical protein